MSGIANEINQYLAENITNSVKLQCVLKEDFDTFFNKYKLDLEKIMFDH